MANDNAAFIPHPSTPGKPVMMGKKSRRKPSKTTRKLKTTQHKNNKRNPS